MKYGRLDLQANIRRQSSLKYRLTNKLFLSCFAAVFITLIISIASMFSVGLGMFRGIIDSTPAFSVDDYTPSGYFSVIYNCEGEVTDTLVGTDSNRIEATYEEIPEDLINAFVSIEDSRFWQHRGIDFRSITRAVVGVVTNKYSGGASTITQQLIKNTIFDGGMETSTGDRIVRKLQEQYLALQLTKNMDRKEIMKNYLNTINLGANTLGVKAAALRYFNKDVSELTLSECAVIAGITKNPSKYNPIKGQEENAARRSVILQEMYNQGYISKEQQEEAMADDVYSRIQNVNTVITENKTPYSYYTDELIDQVTEALKTQLGYTDTQAYNALFSGGLQIYTPQDPKLQAIVDEEMNNPANYEAAKYSVDYRLSVNQADGQTVHHSSEMLTSWIKHNVNSGFDGLFSSKEAVDEMIAAYKQNNLGEGDSVIAESVNYTLEPQASFVLIEQSTGYVKAISGGRGEKTASRTLNRATDSVRQPGSTFKVITSFAPAVDACGATLGTVYYDAPYGSETKQFKNWWGQDYKGYHSIRDGIAYSMNIVALKCMADTVTPKLGIQYAEKFGISTLQASDQNTVLALGGLTRGVTNLELTGAFATIANHGTYTKPMFFTQILNHDGRVLIDNTPETRQVIKESTAYLITSAMVDVTQGPVMYTRSGAGVNPTGTAASVPGMTIAGKSGTTTNNVDIWFEGFSPYYTAGIWGGCDHNQSLRDSSGSANGGTSYHKRIWKNIMTRVHEGLPDTGFTVPDNIVTASICRKSGKLAVDGVCDADPRGSTVYTEYFADGSVPTEACDIHALVTVCGESGQLPTNFCPAENQISKAVMILPEDSADTDDSAYGMPVECTLHTSGTLLPFGPDGAEGNLGPADYDHQGLPGPWNSDSSTTSPGPQPTAPQHSTEGYNAPSYPGQSNLSQAPGGAEMHALTNEPLDEDSFYDEDYDN